MCDLEFLYILYVLYDLYMLIPRINISFPYSLKPFRHDSVYYLSLQTKLDH